MTSYERSLTILVAEDDILIGELLSDMLAGMGHKVCGVEATEAGTVAAAYLHAPDLMIVDLHLNPGSGVGAVDQILQRLFIPHIFVSGNIAKLIELRPDAIHLVKPYTQGSLEEVVRLCCRAYYHVS